ncbi:hypothetical protein [Streptomyces tailanensis]|uniref:hypothetical protein n=1 Tax=Streptomyces tailanensis TaxID=2569858 RepID=UPI00122E5775|nr:hypothetical protein [Streptomyces tailanensis]
MAVRRVQQGLDAAGEGQFTGVEVLAGAAENEAPDHIGRGEQRQHHLAGGAVDLVGLVVAVGAAPPGAVGDVFHRGGPEFTVCGVHEHRMPLAHAPVHQIFERCSSDPLRGPALGAAGLPSVMQLHEDGGRGTEAGDEFLPHQVPQGLGGLVLDQRDRQVEHAFVIVRGQLPHASRVLCTDDPLFAFCWMIYSLQRFVG